MALHRQRRPARRVRRERPGEPRLRLHRGRRRGARHRRGRSDPAARGDTRAGLRGSSQPLAPRLSRQLGPQPGRLRGVRDGRRPPLRRLLSRSAAGGPGAAARAAARSVERAQPRPLPGAPVGRRGRALARLLTAALPRAAERVLRLRQGGRAHRYRDRGRPGPQWGTRGDRAHDPGPVPAGDAVPGRRCSRREANDVPRPAALRRALLPPALLRIPRPPRALLRGRRDRGHRQGHRPARGGPSGCATCCHGAPSRCG